MPRIPRQKRKKLGSGGEFRYVEPINIVNPKAPKQYPIYKAPRDPNAMYRNAAKGTAEPMVGMDDPIFNAALLGYGYATAPVRSFNKHIVPKDKTLGNRVGTVEEVTRIKNSDEYLESRYLQRLDDPYTVQAEEELAAGTTDVPSFNSQLNRLKLRAEHGRLRQNLRPKEVMTNKEFEEAAQRMNDYRELFKKYEKAVRKDENPGEMIFNALSGRNRTEEIRADFENLYPNMRRPKFRPPLDKDYIQNLNTFITKTERKTSPAKIAQLDSKNFDKFPHELQNYTQGAPTPWSIRDPYSYLSEFRGSPDINLSFEQINKLLPDEAARLAKTNSDRLKKEAFERALGGNKYTGKDAYKTISPYGYGGRIRYGDGGEFRYVEPKNIVNPPARKQYPIYKAPRDPNTMYRNAAKGTVEPMVGMDDPIFNAALLGYGYATAPTRSITKGVVSSKKVPKNNFKSEIDWAKWNSETPKHKVLMDEYHAIEESTKKAGTWMKNPDGSPFQGRPEQFVQQQSSWFKKAFPNPVRNSKSNIQTNYHVSPNENITEFKEEFFKRGHFGKGLYTSPDKEATKYYYDFAKGDKTGDVGKAYELYINSNNPITKNANALKSDKSINFWEYGYNLEDFPTRQQLAEKYKLLGNTDEQIDKILKTFKETPREVKKIPFADNDFLRIEGMPGGVEQVTPFYNRVKSMIGNVGFFDMTNPNIYKAVVPTIMGATALKTRQQKREGGEVEPYNISDPKEFKRANKTYQDSLNTYRGAKKIEQRYDSYLGTWNIPPFVIEGSMYERDHKIKPVTRKPYEALNIENAGYSRPENFPFSIGNTRNLLFTTPIYKKPVRKPVYVPTESTQDTVFVPSNEPKVSATSPNDTILELGRSTVGKDGKRLYRKGNQSISEQEFNKLKQMYPNNKIVEYGFGGTIGNILSNGAGLLNLIPGIGQATAPIVSMAGNALAQVDGKQKFDPMQMAMSGLSAFSPIPVKHADGGEVQLAPINIEGHNVSSTSMANSSKGELLVKDGRIHKNYISRPPHPEFGMDPRGNDEQLEGMIVIPKNRTKEYLHSDMRTRKAIERSLISRQAYRDRLASRMLEFRKPKMSQGGRVPGTQDGRVVTNMFGDGGINTADENYQTSLIEGSYNDYMRAARNTALGIGLPGTTPDVYSNYYMGDIYNNAQASQRSGTQPAQFNPRFNPGRARLNYNLNAPALKSTDPNSIAGLRQTNDPFAPPKLRPQTDGSTSYSGKYGKGSGSCWGDSCLDKANRITTAMGLPVLASDAMDMFSKVETYDPTLLKHINGKYIDENTGYRNVQNAFAAGRYNLRDSGMLSRRGMIGMASKEADSQANRLIGIRNQNAGISNQISDMNSEIDKYNAQVSDQAKQFYLQGKANRRLARRKFGEDLFNLGQTYFSNRLYSLALPK